MSVWHGSSVRRQPERHDPGGQRSDGDASERPANGSYRAGPIHAIVLLVAHGVILATGWPERNFGAAATRCATVRSVVQNGFVVQSPAARVFVQEGFFCTKSNESEIRRVVVAET